MTSTTPASTNPKFVGYEISPVACINKTAEAYRNADEALAALAAADAEGDDTRELVWGLYGQQAGGGVQHIADLPTEADVLALYRAITGMPTPEPSGAQHLLPAAAPAPVRVVVVLEGGVIQNILSDGGAPVELLVKDYDTEGTDDEDTHAYLDGSGGLFLATEGPMQISAEIVADCFGQLDLPENRWTIEVYGRPGACWVTEPGDEDEGATLTTTADYELAAKYSAAEVGTTLDELVQRYPEQSFRLVRARAA